MRHDQKFMPGPGQHNLKSSFETNKDHRRGYTFGASNDTYAKVYNECLPEKKGWTDPGLYKIDSFADKVKSGRKRIFFGEKCYEGVEKINLQSPGPGQYQDDKTESINKFGSYTNGKYHNSGAQNFAQGPRKTFMDAAEKHSKRGHPGPGQYKDGLDMQKRRNPSND